MKRLLPSALAVLILVAAESPDSSKKDHDQMQGDWAAVSMVRDGQVYPDEDAQAYFRTVKGDVSIAYRFSKLVGKSTFRLDTTKNPKVIDFTPDGGKPGPMAGIYMLEGDKLTLCIALPGKPRPTKFASEPDSGWTLSVWRREKK